MSLLNLSASVPRSRLMWLSLISSGQIWCLGHYQLNTGRHILIGEVLITFSKKPLPSSFYCAVSFFHHPQWIYSTHLFGVFLLCSRKKMFVKAKNVLTHDPRSWHLCRYRRSHSQQCQVSYTSCIQNRAQEQGGLEEQMNGMERVLW